MQKFTYHCHTNSLQIFDGRNSVEEMVARAEQLGFEAIGISNHLICHPAIGMIDKYAPMYFRDYKEAEEAYKRVSEEVRTVSLKHKIKVLVGFEVDYFKDALWENFFERLRQTLDADYYIGASHFIYNSDYSAVNKIAYLRTRPQTLDTDTITNGLHNHWGNIIAAVNSGYFDFMAHLDLIRDKGFCLGTEWEEPRWQVIEALDKTKTAFELSTKGLRNGTEMYPTHWMVKELCRRQVPVLISDDAHNTESLGENFSVAESLLQDLNYTTRFTL